MNKSSRTFVMGDIHGAYRALKQVLKRSNFDYDNDILIQLGDVSDGWSETYECVEELLKIKNLIAIRGNHDYWTLQWMRTNIVDSAHVSHGGFATIKSYEKHNGVPVEHLRFFLNQIKYYHDQSTNRFFTHGGFTLGIHPLDQSETNYMWVRLWNTLKSQPKKSREICDIFSEIYIGHTAIDKKEPSKLLNVWNMDTGAGWHGYLTMMDVNSKDIFRSKKVKNLYKNEPGRR